VCNFQIRKSTATYYGVDGHLIGLDSDPALLGNGYPSIRLKSKMASERSELKIGRTSVFITDD
jgi:hypothetical protein